MSNAFLQKILDRNRDWARQTTERDPEFFSRLAEQQAPEIFWIGCSDARVPADRLLNLDPGQVFVHRNIANQVYQIDVNCLSVLEYAVNVLKVKHIIVCGHYGCGGVKAAMSNHNYDLVLKMWLRNIKDVYHLYQEELESIKDEEARTDRLVELNVQEQVMKLAKTSIIQRAWKYDDRPVLHGWVYGLKDGIIKSLFDMRPGTDLDPVYKYDDL